MKLTTEQLHKAIAGRASAIRCITRLQPSGGAGASLFPPTYVVGDEGGKYAMEARQLGTDTKVASAVLLDSVPSQANRIEEALQRAIDEERLKLPLFVVTLPPDQRVTSLEAPHRIADAIFRDSELGGVAFRDSDAGNSFVSANVRNATALYQLCPTALIFGTWDSTGASGGLGNKFARALVSEVIGYHAQTFKKTAGRIDPLGVTKMELHVKKDDPSIYEVPKPGTPPPEGFKVGKPSEINHGNVAPSLSEGGVTIAWAEQTSVLSLPALRRLRFPVNGKLDKDSEDAARTVLAALALVGLTLAQEEGYDFRSRCQLIPEQEPEFELVGTTLKDVTKFMLTSTEALAVFDEAVTAAAKVGLKWETKPVTLSPTTRLKNLVEAARAARTAGE
jgi:CRISPR-associated protein Csb1